MLSTLKRFFVGDEGTTDLEEESGDDEGLVQIPKINTAVTCRNTSGTAPLSPTTAKKSLNAGGGSGGEGEDEEVDRMKATGTITAFDYPTGTGVIDRQYKFVLSELSNVTPTLTFDRGMKVEFEAERVKVAEGSSTTRWLVTSVKTYESRAEKVNKERSRFRKLVAKVKYVDPQKIQVEAPKVDRERDRDRMAPRGRGGGGGGGGPAGPVITIPNKAEFVPGKDLEWIVGDWVEIHLKRVDTAEEGNDVNELPVDQISSLILSVSPLRKKTFVGKLRMNMNHSFVDDAIISPRSNISKVQFPIGTIVKCTAIQSLQYVGQRGQGPPNSVHWRVLQIEKSQFFHYATAKATANDMASDFESEWQPDEAGREAMARYHDLMLDKYGVKILPQSWIKFPEMLTGESTSKMVTIKNSSQERVTLTKISFNQDLSVCQFELMSNGQPHDLNEQFIFLPNEELRLEIICRPLMTGRTTEMMVFQFVKGEDENFAIARNIHITAFSEQEELLNVEGKGEENGRQAKRHTRSEDLVKIIMDRDRRHIRGNFLFRAPFFSQKRLPQNPVQKELYHILKDQDEQELERVFPSTSQDLTFQNYKEKFQVSVWFEEIENELRRRHYDMVNVVLTKFVFGMQIHYTFQAPGIQDFQPPIHMQDTIDVFDAENPSNAKFQGTITKIFDTEVTCIFSDAFNLQYTGFPLTVQFNLGRTIYKRCHFAVQTAHEYLGEGYLFPNEDFHVKSPRIHVIEEDEGDENESESKSDGISDQSDPSSTTPSKSISIFNKSPRCAAAFPSLALQLDLATAENSVSGIGNVLGRRCKSVRSRFVSTTRNSPSCQEAQLRWFNTKLNQEQKNAVRRILRGQARPLPYIIFGPPGTGKTVTLVEAVMQVNKLDKNSRILVCAPSNAAADIVAEHLANSDLYHPGDFVRLNGFLRAGQAIPETIEPFCTDGDDLHNVAMHRLIVATCMTAGQFFTLDLTLGHFTHVFIDEAGYCTEPETMVPAVLVALSKGGQLILAGDHMQLGPVLMSDAAQNCGLNISFMERMMKRKLYSRDPDRFPNEKYNPLVVTKLVRNYRAHPALLKLPSTLFYDDDLIPAALQEETADLLEDPHVKAMLVNEGVPIIFRGVQARCSREGDSPSWFNNAEAVEVVKYAMQLLRGKKLKPEDIGIITPYRKQVEKIRLALQMNLLGEDELPKVASVEEFQGGERKVIIISTVRSMNEGKIDECLDRLSFIYQPKRFNVVITRAKALMIVVGNPHVLCGSRLWMRLLNYSVELGAYTGCNLPSGLGQNQIMDLMLPPGREQVEGGAEEMEVEAEVEVNDEDFQSAEDEGQASPETHGHDGGHHVDIENENENKENEAVGELELTMDEDDVSK